MRKPSLSVDTFVAALATLATLGVSATACSKAAPSVSPEPAPSSSSLSSLSLVSAPTAVGKMRALHLDLSVPKPSAEAAKTSATTTQQPLVGATPVDGGKAAPKAGTDKNPSASCGAGGCTPDMKKDSGN